MTGKGEPAAVCKKNRTVVGRIPHLKCWAGQTLSSYQIRDDQDELADIERLRQVSLVASD